MPAGWTVLSSHARRPLARSLRIQSQMQPALQVQLVEEALSLFARLVPESLAHCCREAGEHELENGLVLLHLQSAALIAPESRRWQKLPIAWDHVQVRTFAVHLLQQEVFGFPLLRLASQFCP